MIKTEKHKLKILTFLWCEWNRHEKNGDDVMHEIGKLYKKETLETWNDPLTKLVV